MNYKIGNYCSLFFVVLLYVSCSENSGSNPEDAIARVNDEYLYLDDISSLIANANSSEDSLYIIRNYVDNWVREQLILEKARINLTEEQQNFEKQLQNYKNSLLMYTFEEKLIEQKLDTSIGETDIEIFYVYNQENFELKENIVKCIFVKVPLNAPNIGNINQLLSSKEKNDKEILNEYCVQFAEKCSFDTSQWITFEKVNSQLPEPIANPLQFLQNHRKYAVEDSAFKYILLISDYRIRSSLSPKSFVRDQIRAIILNERRINLINEIKQEIYEEGTLKQRYEIYLAEEE